jgi:eukaryotic-like serine/threonine-protein kinase
MPSRLGRYAVRRRIGSGGFATVWLAYDEQLDSPVAVKVLAENWTEDAHVRQRFLEEGRFLRKVESPHVVTVYDAGSLDDDRPYLVMTYADQGTLADRLELEGFTVPQACEVVRQIGEGLQALHERGVLHRDIKPANVLFRTVDARNGKNDSTWVRAMVGDLGLGKALDVSSRLTMIAGTPSYVAPEQAQGEHLDARADQFSLAALSYLLLTGRAPYSHSSLSAAAHPAPPAPMSNGERKFPRAVEDVIRRGMAVDREERFPEVMSFVTALREALGEAGVGALPQRWVPVDPDLTQPGNRPTLPPAQGELPAPTPPKRRPWWPAAVLAVVLLIGGGIGGYAWWHETHSSKTFTDDDGTLSVTVPSSWARDVSLDGWVPPDSPFTQSALAVGDRGDWRASGQGVFVGLMPEGKLPKKLPQHPSCHTPGATRRSTEGDPTLTSISTGCPGVIIERAVQVSGNTLLWVQVRSDNEETAQDVLSSVRTRGSLG